MNVAYDLPELERLIAAFAEAAGQSTPFRYWTMRDLLPRSFLPDLAALVPAALGSNDGRRATHNEHRAFCSVQSRRESPIWRNLAELLQHSATVTAIARLCGADLSGSYLRIEYCADQDGFWLEPHTDIGAKRLTLLTYLNDELGSEAWGTHLLDPDGTLVRRMPAIRNTALMFVPASDTWHGFAARCFGVQDLDPAVLRHASAI